MSESDDEADSPHQMPPLQLAFPLPASPDTYMQLHLTAHLHSVVLLVHTSSATASSSGPASLGSFVYAIPNQLHPNEPPLSTSLYSSTQSIDFATRLAKILARRCKRPAYVGAGEVKFWEASDEAAAMKGTAEIVVEALKRAEK